MRVLISTVPAHGHLLSLLPLARAALRAGHEVVVASGAEGAAEARRRGFDVWEVPPARGENEAAARAELGDVGALPPERRTAALVGAVFGGGAIRRAAHLVPRAEAWRPDLVVHPVTELAGAVVAARTGARHAVHGLGPLPAHAWDWFGARLGELAAAWGVPELEKTLLDVPYLDNCPPSLQADAVRDFRRRRPLRPDAGEVLPGERLPWDLDDLPYPRTLHLTLGTIFFGLDDVLRTALAGLAGLEVNVLVTVGPGTDPGRLGPQPPYVRAADFVSHALLLPHCDGLITQGGAGTIVAALCHGLPHLILPQGADQFLNAATAREAGVALVLPPDGLSPEAVAAAARRLLDDPAPARRARLVRDEIAAMPDADTVLAELTSP